MLLEMIAGLICTVGVLVEYIACPPPYMLPDGLEEAPLTAAVTV